MRSHCTKMTIIGPWPSSILTTLTTIRSHAFSHRGPFDTRRQICKPLNIFRSHLSPRSKISRPLLKSVGGTYIEPSDHNYPRHGHKNYVRKKKQKTKEKKRIENAHIFNGIGGCISYTLVHIV